MSEVVNLTLNGVSETLLVTLYIRAMESQRPDALIKDEKAVALVKKIKDEGGYDFSRIKLLHLGDENKLVITLRCRELDRYTRDFLERHPESVVVHIGCGLDTRFERVDNGQVEWFDLDLPHIIDLRRDLMGGEKPRYHLLSCSVLEDAWLEALKPYKERPYLFLAEGVFMYMHEDQVKSLVQTLLAHFPGAQLVFDAYSPVHVWRSNIQTAKFVVRCHWGIWRGQALEKWGSASSGGAGIRLLGEWGFFDDPTSRLDHFRWFSRIESIIRTFRIYSFQLGGIAPWEATDL
jgi:methyltransferase (TIGR00027 family)